MTRRNEKGFVTTTFKFPTSLTLTNLICLFEKVDHEQQLKSQSQLGSRITDQIGEILYLRGGRGL